MAQSLSQIYIHFVFKIKNTSCIIQKKDKQQLFSYMGGIMNNNKCIPIAINGVEDHVHILFIMSKNISLAKFAEYVKKDSSLWIKTIDDFYKNFAWQRGYGGFSIGQSLLPITKKYIENQEEKHKKLSFKEEYLKFLKFNTVDFNEDYLWND